MDGLNSHFYGFSKSAVEVSRLFAKLAPSPEVVSGFSWRAGTPIYGRPGPARFNPDYDSNFRTDCGSELACANMAVPVCTSILYLA